MKSYKYLFILILFTGIMACSNQTKLTEGEAREFLQTLEKEVMPVYSRWNASYFTATASGKDEDYNRVSENELAYSKILADRVKFEKIKNYLKNPAIKDSLLRRELLVWHNNMIKYQVDTAKLKKLIDAQVAVEKKFSTFRAKLDNKLLSDNEIDNILIHSKNSAVLEKAWKASKAIGPLVAEDIKALVKLRNEIAKDLGYSNYHEMSLKISDQDPATITALFDELDSLTRDAFLVLKGEADSILAKQLKISVNQLMPWHYQNRFFQEAPKIYDTDLDKYYAGKDILAVIKRYYEGIGLDVEDIIQRSDLYEREGKYQHAYCTNIDRAGDIRIMANIRNNQYWANTMLHELGHAVYEKYIDTTLPFILREPAHIFTTEAIAIFFGNLASDANWMMKNLNLPLPDVREIANDVRRYARLEKLIFSRWSQVMFRFEKSMYENPDQDLNRLWWDMVEKYQLLKCPEGRNEPDWATKIHIASVPCYYHNYLLGDLFASQLDAYLEENIIGHKNPCYTGHPEIGNYLKANIFKPGSKYYWNDMIEKATGEKLTARYYAENYVQP